MSKMVRSIKEALKRVRDPQGTLLRAWSESYGEVPVITFQDYIDAYVKDPSCGAFVDFLADQAVGMGFYTTANQEYSQAEEAKRAVDEFCEKVNLDGLLQIGAREIVMCGNSFWEKVEPNKIEELRILPLSSIERIKRDVYGNVEGYVQSASYSGKTVGPERIIHFKWNPVNGEAFGRGILRSLLEKMKAGNETRMSFLEMKARIEKMLPEIFEKYAGPDELWIFEGVSDEKLAEYQRLIRSKPKAGARFVYNKPADIRTVQIDPRTQFQSYLEHIVNQLYLGGHTPLPKLFTTPGFTEASARAAIEVAERKVMALQRFAKRIVERDLFDPVVERAGYNPKEAGVRLNWGMREEPEIDLAQIVRLAEISATTGIQYIRPDEMRKFLSKIGVEVWEPEETTQTTK